MYEDTFPLFNSAYTLSIPYTRSLYPIIARELYSGDFLFINLSNQLLLDEFDLEELFHFLTVTLDDVNWFLCCEHTDFTSSYFTNNNNVYLSPVFPLEIRDSESPNPVSGLFFNIHTYPIDYSHYDEYRTIIQYISDLNPIVNLRFPLAVSYKILTS
jgi:hypothetical protein